MGLKSQWLEVPEGLTTLTSREIVPPYLPTLPPRGLSLTNRAHCPNGGVGLKIIQGRYSEGYQLRLLVDKNASSTDFRQAIGDTARLPSALLR